MTLTIGQIIFGAFIAFCAGLTPGFLLGTHTASEAAIDAFQKLVREHEAKL